MKALRDVVVTGQGWLLPPGMTPASFETPLASDAGPAARQLHGFDAAAYVGDPKVLRAMNRVFQIAAAASVLAMRPAGFIAPADLERAGLVPERCGIATAMTEISPVDANLIDAIRDRSAGEKFDLGAFGESARHRLHPFRRLMLLANMAAAHSSLLFGLQGPSFTFNSGTSSGLQAIREACWTIASGRADLMLCEAADSPQNSLHCHPVTEAAAALVLEAEAVARRRGARILACLRPGPEQPCPSHPRVGEPSSEAAFCHHAPAAAGLLAVLARLPDGRAAAERQQPGSLRETAPGYPPEASAAQARPAVLSSLEIVPCAPDPAALTGPSAALAAEKVGTR